MTAGATPQQRRKILAVWNETNSLADTLDVVKDWKITRKYGMPELLFDLWAAKKNNSDECRVRWSGVKSERGLIMAVVSQAIFDLEAGMPCTYQACNVVSGAYTCDNDAHVCAISAYEFLTSTVAMDYCDVLKLDYCVAMKKVEEARATVERVFPWLLLSASLIYRIACTLEGEAGAMGHQGMWYVADTMLSRMDTGQYQDWDAVLTGYSAYKCPPSEDAMQIARRMLVAPWQSSGRIYAYSEQDRARMGWKTGDIVYSRNGLTLHLRTIWPGSAGTVTAFAGSGKSGHSLGGLGYATARVLRLVSASA